ncbi:SdpI family protein [Priestia taiwanensis]|uniref:DUF1648 domain-containing protein n=1 Tax=Priestia taiwanensis TaxID=1347902 RepID=A0A917AR69_9BACI|nr:SdpI family protein [Priestia taiwanensis]MBM7363139.1 putative membrane protein [Priestia taiwanensis]GGE68007.1 hypothetical protein GCM10007140_17590 [Priestia taiwanensis]
MSKPYRIRDEWKQTWVHITILCMSSYGAILVLLRDRLPEQIAIHWGPDDVADGFAGFWEGLVLFPYGFMVLMFLTVLVVPKFAKKGQLSPNNLKSLRLIASIMSLTNLLLFSYVALKNAGGIEMQPSSLVLLIVGSTTLIGGIIFPKLSPNPYIGIRTKALLEDEELWRKVHRLSAPIWIGFGLIAIVVALTIPLAPAAQLVILLGPLVVTGVLIQIVKKRRT